MSEPKQFVDADQLRQVVTKVRDKFVSKATEGATPLKIAVVTSLPSVVDPNTLYFIKE